MSGYWWVGVVIAAFLVVVIVSGAQWRTTRADVERIVTATPKFETSCILCYRRLPEEALEYVVPTRDEMWCQDLTECKTYRANRIGANS